MKKSQILLMVTMLFILSMPAFADIKGKIIVRGKWGDGEKQFGVDVSEPMGAGPSIFTVSPSGDVYIADFVNNRIVVYDHNGNFLKSFPVNGWINSIEVDSKNNIYYTNDNGLTIIDNDGKVISTLEYRGLVRLDRDKIYLWQGRISSCLELRLDQNTKEVKVLRRIEDTASDIAIITNGIEFRCSPDSLMKKTGIAYITINNKPTEIKKIVKGRIEPIKIDPANICENLSRFYILDGDENGNVYMYHFDCLVRIDSTGELTGKFIIPYDDYDDLKYVSSLPYGPSGDCRIKNGKIYFMAATPCDRSNYVRIKRGSTNYLGCPDDEFMILEYEFQPVK